ncbi:GLPGLI family protein [Flavobacteriaceae bacterium XHP0103]|uniref:GLPGLI family protein n=1 Tax=Marixanthotalea marina TaxID=2844359 RepID=UPI002989F429|nr:GLPGLI family protein [Marixanthotalea marina]MBU3821923.1 GLPGLI family protein [Marixanthotalea marina]
MKTTSFKIVFAFLLLFAAKVSFSQNDFQGVAYYQTKTSMDMNFGGRQMTEAQKKQIAERMRSSLENTYILTFNQTESLYKEEEKLEAPAQGGGMGFRMMGAGGGESYKNVKEQKLIKEADLYGKQFLIVDNLPDLNWDMGTESKMIGQYLCFKATAVRKVQAGGGMPFGRNNENQEEKPTEYTVTAWYTPQVPVNQGPADYWGLPGLILELHDNDTVILCSKIIINPAEKTKIKMPSKGKEVTSSEYEEIAAKKEAEMRENSGGQRRGGGGFRPF